MVALLSSQTARATGFLQRIEAGGKTLQLNGSGLCEYGFFKVDLYRGALYLENQSKDAEQIIRSSETKRIQLDFVYELTAKQLRKAYSAALRANAGKDLPRYEDGLIRLKKLLVAVKPGDSLAFTYLPGKQSLEVALNSQVLGTIPGEGWSQMFFRLYLGSTPPDPNLRKGMLGL